MAVKKIAGWREWAIKRDLAEGEKSQRQIATKYGVTQAAIHQFLDKNRAEIDEMRGRLEDALEELWIADKKLRIAGIQDIADEMSDAHGRGEVSERGSRAEISVVEARRLVLQAYRAVADELGDIPQRLKIEGGKDPVRHVLEGVDTEKLT